MSFAICSLASGSSGNCYLIKSDNAAVLVDAGLSNKQIGERLSSVGVSVKDINAVLLTHEHSDHTQGLPVLMKNSGIKLYSNSRTYQSLGKEFDSEKLCFFETGEEFQIADISIKSFKTSHDAADPVGFSLKSEEKVITIVTDTGYVTEGAFCEIVKADLLVLESNHDENILKMGRYPWFLKKRILGEKGHLSNDAAAELLLKLFKDGLWKTSEERFVLLAHLSAENNFPEMALATSSNILEAEGINVGKSVKLFALSRHVQSPLFTI